MESSFSHLLNSNLMLVFVPEILIVLLSLVSLVLRDSISPSINKARGIINGVSLGGIFAYIVWGLMTISPAQKLIYLNGSFIINYFTLFFKALVILILLIIILVTRRKSNTFHFLLLAGSLGSLILISANDFMLLFTALELMALSSIILIAYDRFKAGSTEASIKYLISNSIVATFLLFGIAYIYGMSLSLDVNSQSPTFLQEIINTRLTFGMSDGFSFYLCHLALIFFAFVFAFKLALFPFQSWAPDVYEGTSLKSLMFLTTITKIAIISFLIRLVWNFLFVLSVPLISSTNILNMPIVENLQTPIGSFLMLMAIFAIGSMWYGNLMGLRQIKKDLAQISLKKIMAYSAMAQTGYIISIICLNPVFGLTQAIYFLVIYNLFNLGVFITLSQLRNKDNEELNYCSLESIKGLFHKYPKTSVFLAICFASLAGIIPTMLLPKILLIQSLLQSFAVNLFTVDLISLSFISNTVIFLMLISVIITSLISVYYYFSIIKNIFADVKITNILTESVNRLSFRILSVLILALGLVIIILPNISYSTIAQNVTKSAISIWQ